jgi:hypothetical protein
MGLPEGRRPLVCAADVRGLLDVIHYLFNKNPCMCRCWNLSRALGRVKTADIIKGVRGVCPNSDVLLPILDSVLIKLRRIIRQ